MMMNESKPLIFRIARTALITAAFLLIFVVTAAPWTLSDFVIMGGLVFGIGTAYELIATKADKKYKVATGVGLALTFFLIWAELAVGVFGTPFAGS